MGKFQFAGDVEGRSVTPARRYGTKASGMTADVGGWKGMIRTRVWYNATKDCDMFKVVLIPHWDDDGGGYHCGGVVLAEGILDHRIADPFVVPALFA